METAESSLGAAGGEELDLVERRAGNKFIARKDRSAESRDDYETPAFAVAALLARHPEIDGTILDPCCGPGSIVREVRRLRPSACVQGVELRDIAVPDGCCAGVDGLAEMRAIALAGHGPRWVVMNPPFKQAMAFTLAAIDATQDGVAVFQRTAWTESSGRYEDLWSREQASHQWIFSCRCDCYPEGQMDFSKGMLSFAWFVFRRAHRGPMATGWIHEPMDWSHDTRAVDVDALRARVARLRAELAGELPEKDRKKKQATAREIERGVAAYLERQAVAAGSAR